jgi:hypothetical protein
VAHQRKRFWPFVVLAALLLPALPIAGTEKVSASASVGASLVRGAGLHQVLAAPRFTYRIECRDAAGRVKWAETVENLVTTQGGNDLIDKYFKGSAYTATWYMGLAGVGAKALADTLASHAAWAELTPYAGNRPAITFGTTSAKSNTATAVSYAITGTATVAGAFVANVNTGTAGILYSVSDFAASRSVVSGDTLNVTLTVSV